MDSASPNLPLMGIQPRTKLSIIITRINLCLTAADFKYSSLLSMKDNRIIIVNVTDPFCFASTVRILTLHSPHSSQMDQNFILFGFQTVWHPYHTRLGDQCSWKTECEWVEWHGCWTKLFFHFLPFSVLIFHNCLFFFKKLRARTPRFSRQRLPSARQFSRPNSF